MFDRLAACARRVVYPLVFVSLALPACAQQSYVGRFDAFAGYTYLDSPKLKLSENGVHFQAGVRPRTWVTLGFDYSYSTGDTALTPDLLLTSLQQTLGAQLGQLAAIGRLPANYQLSVPLHSETQTFAAGPQFPYRRWERITPFIRPSIGYIHETATPHPGDPIATAIVAQLAPSGNKQDWTPFYGVGGGFDLNLGRHFSIHAQADFVHDHLFNDLLKEGRNTVRFSIGPAFQFGGNVRK